MSPRKSQRLVSIYAVSETYFIAVWWAKIRMFERIQDDGMKLFRDYGILASNLVELGALACQVDKNFASTFRRPIVSLAKVVSYFLCKTLDKGLVRVSDWSKDLTREQMKCKYLSKTNLNNMAVSWSLDASNDVHSGLEVYKSLMRTARLSKAQLTPERYTADLAGELRGRGEKDLICQTAHDRGVRTPSGGGPPHRQAYTLWHQGHGLLDICIRMRNQANPQSETVVMCVHISSSRQGVLTKLENCIKCSSYILRALNEDPTLLFSVEALINLVRLDSSSWTYHRDTIEHWAQEGRGFNGC